MSEQHQPSMTQTQTKVEKVLKIIGYSLLGIILMPFFILGLANKPLPVLLTIILVISSPFLFRSIRNQALWQRYPIGRIMLALLVSIFFVGAPKEAPQVASETVQQETPDNKESVLDGRPIISETDKQTEKKPETPETEGIDSEDQAIKARLNGIGEKLKKADADFNNAIASAKSQGLIHKVECGRGASRIKVYVNPSFWALIPLEEKEALASVTLGYCINRGSNGYLRVYNMMDGKELALLTGSGLHIK